MILQDVEIEVTKLTERQASVLADMRKLPKRYRVHGRTDAPLKMEVLEIYDARIWRGLFERGFLTFTSNGVAVTCSEGGAQ